MFRAELNVCLLRDTDLHILRGRIVIIVISQTATVNIVYTNFKLKQQQVNEYTWNVVLLIKQTGHLKAKSQNMLLFPFILILSPSLQLSSLSCVTTINRHWIPLQIYENIKYTAVSLNCLQETLPHYYCNPAIITPFFHLLEICYIFMVCRNLRSFRKIGHSWYRNV